MIRLTPVGHYLAQARMVTSGGLEATLKRSAREVWPCILSMCRAHVIHFPDLRSLMAKATPLRSGDCLAGVAAQSAVERIAAQMRLADLPLSTFLSEPVIPYEEDEVTRLIVDSHDKTAFCSDLELHGWGISRLAAFGRRNWRRSRRAGCRDHAGNGCCGLRRFRATRTSSPSPRKSASSPAFETRSACPARFLRAFSPITLPTIQRAFLQA